MLSWNITAICSNVHWQLLFWQLGYTHQVVDWRHSTTATKQRKYCCCHIPNWSIQRKVVATLFWKYFDRTVVNNVKVVNALSLHLNFLSIRQNMIWWQNPFLLTWIWNSQASFHQKCYCEAQILFSIFFYFFAFLYIFIYLSIYLFIYLLKELTVTLKCQQLRQLLFCLFFPHFLQRVRGCDQYSDRQSLTPCQHLRSRASSSSVPLSISEAEFMADCPPSVTSGTVWLIWPVVLMCSGMHDAYCLPLARLSESARENVQENRDIHPSLPPSLSFFFFFSFSSCSSLLSPASFQGWATGSSWGPAQVEAWLQPGPLAE